MKATTVAVVTAISTTDQQCVTPHVLSEGKENYFLAQSRLNLTKVSYFQS